jgi:hypothetical protein
MDHVLDRIEAITLKPQTEWAVIERETDDPSDLLNRYVAILALIPSLASFIGSSLLTARTPVLVGLVGGIATYVLSFVLVYAAALIIDSTAPTYGGQQNLPNAIKLSVYSFTPMWLAGFFLLVPSLSFFSLLGLYGLYLLWVGLPNLMRVPREQAMVCAAVAGGGTLALMMFISGLQWMLVGLLR